MGKGSPTRRRWVAVFRVRMNAGLEPCRNIGCTDRATTFGHLKPRSRGGHFTIHNITLLCHRCNIWQDNQWWPWLRSLRHEHRRPERLHAFVEQEITRMGAVMYTRMQWCTVGGVSGTQAEKDKLAEEIRRKLDTTGVE